MNAKKAKGLRQLARELVKLNPKQNIETVYKGIKKSYKNKGKV